MRSYTWSGHVPIDGLLIMLVAVVAGSIILGGLMYLIGTAIYFICMFPIAVGLAAGFVTAKASIIAKVRSPLVRAVFGLLMGLAAYGVYRYAEYEFEFRRDLRDEIETSLGESISNSEYNMFEDQFLEEAVGDTGFIGFTKLNAREGFTITSRRSSSTDGAGVTGDSVYAYWVLEIILMAGGGLFMALSGVSQPFSEQTNEWFGKPDHLALIPPENANAVVGLLNRGDINALAGGLVISPNRPIPRLELTLRRCSSADAEQYLAVEKITRGRYGEEREVVQGWLIAPPELTQLKQALQPQANS